MPEREAQEAIAAEPEARHTGARVVREIIRTPAFREIIKLNLAAIDPDSARETVRTLLREDVNFSLGLMGTSPRMINYLAEAVLEFGRQLGGFPPEMRGAFLTDVLAEIDGERLRQVPRVWAPILEDALLADPALRERARSVLCEGLNGLVHAAAAVLRSIDEAPSPAADAAKGPALDAAALGRAVTLSARLVNRSMAANPRFLRELFANVDLWQVARAGWSLLAAMAGAALCGIANRLMNVFGKRTGREDD